MFIPIFSVLLALGAARASRVQVSLSALCLSNLVCYSAEQAHHDLATGSITELTGDSKCVEPVCISATDFHNSTTQCTLTSSSTSSIEWIVMGFGAIIANYPMVIIWPNSQGSVTLN